MKNISKLNFYLFTAKEKPYSPLQLIQIFFNTATYDKIDRDVKITIEAQLGVIGGTMGLLTGFSLLSAVEVIFFAAKYFMSLYVTRTEIRRGPIVHNKWY